MSQLGNCASCTLCTLPFQCTAHLALTGCRCYEASKRRSVVGDYNRQAFTGILRKRVNAHALQNDVFRFQITSPQSQRCCFQYFNKNIKTYNISNNTSNIAIFWPTHQNSRYVNQNIKTRDISTKTSKLTLFRPKHQNSQYIN